MADERRKGPPDRRKSRGAKQAQTGGASDGNANERARGQDPNDVARFDAEQLDEAIREREQEDRGETF